MAGGLTSGLAVRSQSQDKNGEAKSSRSAPVANTSTNLLTSFDSYDSFRSSTRAFRNGEPLFIAGRNSPADGGEGTFVYLADSSRADDGGTLLNSRRGSAARVFDGRLDVRWWGADPTGQTDSTKAFQSCVDSLLQTDQAIAKGLISIPPGEYILTHSINLHRVGITFSGANGTTLRWAGHKGYAMFSVTDSYKCGWTDMTILGDRLNPPLAAIRFYSPNMTVVGTNELHEVRNVVFGTRFGQGEEQTFPLENGILIDGEFNGNNDQFYLDKCVFHSCSQAGLAILNAQSIWGSIKDCLFNQCGIGIHTGSNITLYNVLFNRNRINDIKVFRRILVSVFGFHSENSVESIRLDQDASLFIDGGKIVVSTNGIAPNPYWLNVNSSIRTSVTNLTVAFVGDVRQSIRFKASQIGVPCSLRLSNNHIGDMSQPLDIDVSSPPSTLLHIDIEHGLSRSNGINPISVAIDRLASQRAVTWTTFDSPKQWSEYKPIVLARSIHPRTFRATAWVKGEKTYVATHTNRDQAKSSMGTIAFCRPIEKREIGGYVEVTPPAAIQPRASVTSLVDKALFLPGSFAVLRPMNLRSTLLLVSGSTNHSGRIQLNWTNPTDNTLRLDLRALVLILQPQIGTTYSFDFFENGRLTEKFVKRFEAPGVKKEDFVLLGYVECENKIFLYPYCEVDGFIDILFDVWDTSLITISQLRISVFSIRPYCSDNLA